MSFMMSSPSGPNAAGLPRGELLATYSTYADAREQVDRLAATDFPVSAVSIVGKDLRVVERVRGRLDYAQVALGSGLRGLLIGGMIGAFLWMLNPAAGPLQILTSALLGVAVWVIFGVLGFAMSKGRHGFASTQAVVPAAYDLVVAFEHSARARQELGIAAGAAAAPVSAPAPAAPAAEVQARDAAGHGSHAAGSAPVTSAAAESPRGDDDAPAGLDRSYGVTLPPEEVQKLIEARGGRPAATPGPQDARRPDPQD